MSNIFKGAELVDNVLDTVRKEAENCDWACESVEGQGDQRNAEVAISCDCVQCMIDAQPHTDPNYREDRVSDTEAFLRNARQVGSSFLFWLRSR